MANSEHPITALVDEEDFDVLRYDEDRLEAGMIYAFPGSLGYSPDGVGMYWYDSMDELVEDVG